MSKLFSRTSCAIVLGLTLAFRIDAAAATRVVVDDDLSCPGADFSHLQDAIDFIGSNPGTITVCPGIYRGRFSVIEGNDLRLIGAKGAVIAPSFVTSPLFTGVLLRVERSTNVTVQGLTFDGMGALQSFGDPNAIAYADSTGTIRKNTIRNWHRPGYRGPDLVDGRPAGLLHAIHAIDFALPPGPPQTLTVEIVGNTITDYQERAIDVEGDLAVHISNNRITAGLPPDPAATFSIGIHLQAAGPFDLKSPIGLVQGNTITGHGGPVSDRGIDTGIVARQVGSLEVLRNKISQVAVGMVFFANCFSPADSNGNTIKANRITRALNGIEVTAIGGFPEATCDPHVDDYVIRGNRIVNDFRDPLAIGLSGILFDVRGTGAGRAFALNETVKGNTITFYVVGVNTLPQPGGTITGVFEPNRILLGPPR
jgi:hypothetical protein